MYYKHLSLIGINKNELKELFKQIKGTLSISLIKGGIN